jgi:3-hydroxyacyl-CoA dehydrogenase
VGVATAAASLAEALDGAWLAIESVPEKLETKLPLWGQIDQAAPTETIFATNSSSYPSRLMAEKVRDKSRLCNMHFYMPPPCGQARRQELHGGPDGVSDDAVPEPRREPLDLGDDRRRGVSG